MAGRTKILRQQILKNVSQPAAIIEEKIVDALMQQGEFEGNLDSQDLGLIMRKVAYSLVAEQKLVGFNLPLVHNVSYMDACIADSEARVNCEIHIHQPIKAFIKFKYTLENSANAGRLRLKNGQVEVEEITQPFDLAAKLALRVMGVHGIALRELSDPNGIIQRTLPKQFRHYGFDGEVNNVDLNINSDNTMAVSITTAAARPTL